MDNDYKKIALFSDEDNVVEEIDNFTLVQEERSKGKFVYKIFNPLDALVDHWTSSEDCLAMTPNRYEKSVAKMIFDYSVPKYDDGQRYYDYSPFGYQTKSTGFLDKLNKSDTLVIHCEDRTTDMLRQIYAGKNWDVLRDGNIDKDELHQLLNSHDKIVCLGHGTPRGLINIQGSGYTIGDEEAKYLKGKKLFMIWCHASSYALRHSGMHGLITGNMPSDKWEARAVGFFVEEKYMDDNITFWAKCCAKYVDQSLNGNAEEAARNIRKEYLKVYGDETQWNDQELGITNYNAERTIAI